MSFRVISKGAMSRFVASLQNDYRVVGPRPVDGQYVFDDVRSTDELHLDYTQTVIPPKKYLLPQREELLRFKMDGSQIEPTFDGRQTVVLGVHTCDVHAIQLLDKVFNTGFVDQHYRKRRENTLLIGVECLKPCSKHSFCKSMGTLSATDGFDLHLTDLSTPDDAAETVEYAIDVGSDRGRALLDRHAETRPATEADYKRLNGVLAEKWPRFWYRLDFDVSELPSLLRVSYKSPLWEELGRRCLSCGSCTNVCPTCYCFNVQDEVDFALSLGKRTRVWDSCQLDEFATVAGGHNFRPARAARQRHRFLRKGQYQADAYGLLGCVGCGRCGQACLAKINPVDTFNALYHERVDARHAARNSLT
ncbi:MAG TPA: 4Fe-4S dicluster domain-containing protein [Anaerolineae bacterium]|nr:4Fe-4S dicluster domain-containing protein [Anaerolineae bacterium]